MRARGVDGVHSFLEDRDDVGAGHERVACAARAAQGGEPALECREVRHEERGNELAAIAEQDGLGDERMAPELVLNRLGRDALPAGGDDEVLLPIGDRQVALSVKGPDIAGVKPAVWLEDGSRRLGPAVIAAHDVRTAREDLAVLGEPQLERQESRGRRCRTSAGRAG